MNNPLMSMLSGRGENPLQMIQQIKANPMAFLMQRNLNIPANIASDPNAIIQHLLSTGQVTQEQLNQAYQTVRQYR